MRIPLPDWKRVVAEQQSLDGLHVDNVYQVDPRAFLLKLTPGKLFFLIDANRGRARALVTDEPPKIPDRPPMFGSILRRALRGGRVLGVALLAEDRIVAVDVEVGGEPRRLVVEAISSHPNLLLLDKGGTVERVLDGEVAKRRKNPIGASYALPPAPKFTEEESLLPADLPAEPYAANFFLDKLARTGVSEAKAEKEGKQRERNLDRIRRALSGIEKDSKKLPDPTALRKQGEFLLENFPALTAGMKKFRGVPLDPKLQPNENVDRIFQQARKAERAGPQLAARKRQLEELLARIEGGEHIPDAALPGRSRGKEPPRRPYRVFLSVHGDRILVGKGGRDNDETTLKVAGPNDIFLHVRGTPGAHVIVPVKKGHEVAEQTLLDAAHLALHYSKQKRAEKADITWTPRRNVKKPKGAKAGLVSVSREKVLHLRREPERLARLLMAIEDSAE
ncbi:MAG: NFACT RNA binding domain-containing protein [Planctomycetota bacterium]|jgi:predicted ribosome quality control (RQC) complex YloA/Tae2 family protein